MTQRTRAAGSALTAALLAAAAMTIAPASAAAEPSGFTVSTLHFDATVGPDGTQHCDVEGDLYTPAGVSAAAPAPAVLTTHGFAQTKDALRPTAEFLAGRGYVVLAYSGLGFGGTGCKVSLDSPDQDGRAAQDLVSFLGGANGIAYRDAAHTQPVPGLDYVVRDTVANNGEALGNDPRVGMIGGSYGGAVQFAAAAVDPRIDALVPMITWNDLSYSLAPNAAAGVSSEVPGVAKTSWALLFTGAGISAPGAAGYQRYPERVLPCPNFVDFVCAELPQAVAQGYPNPAAVQVLRSASVASYADRITVPVLLVQGEQDTLFNLNEARATYDALARRDAPVKMIWQEAGHSAPGLLTGAARKPDPDTQYPTRRYLDWFDHYLKGAAVDTGPTFAYHRDWAADADDPARAYASAPNVDVGQRHSLYLSDGGRLTGERDAIRPGVQTLGTPAGGLVAGSTPSNITVPPGPRPENQPPGSYTSWTGPSLSAPLDVVGAPTVNLQVSTPTPVTGPADAVVLFAKLYDVAPDGAATLVNGQIAPVRVLDPAAPVRVTLPAIVHRFDTGHSVRLVLAGGDSNFRGGLVPRQVSIAAGDPAQQLVLPVVAE
ncbi:CocE/NonD family hydrolase [Rhodococcus sp. NPDC059234]|uniref:CocE/NonD family hydrolase n=1 Tax=Rhodococcus sp. NPDC059234 TaxID=3346781 RepID=UPI00366DAE8F